LEQFGKTKRLFAFILFRGLGFVGGAFTAFTIFILLCLFLVLLPINFDKSNELIRTTLIAISVIGGVIGAFYADFYKKLGLAVLEHWP